MQGKIDDSHAAVSQGPQDVVAGDPRRGDGLDRLAVGPPVIEVIHQGGPQLGRERKRAVNLEEPRQRLGQIGEIDNVILGQGRLALDLAEDDFLVD